MLNCMVTGKRHNYACVVQAMANFAAVYFQHVAYYVSNNRILF